MLGIYILRALFGGPSMGSQQRPQLDRNPNYVGTPVFGNRPFELMQKYQAKVTQKILTPTATTTQVTTGPNLPPVGNLTSPTATRHSRFIYTK